VPVSGPAENGLFVSVSSCLSRACPGKDSVLTIKWRKQGRFPYRVLA
jgi:hypothetical protein